MAVDLRAAVLHPEVPGDDELGVAVGLEGAEGVLARAELGVGGPRVAALWVGAGAGLAVA